MEDLRLNLGNGTLAKSRHLHFANIFFFQFTTHTYFYIFTSGTRTPPNSGQFSHFWVAHYWKILLYSNKYAVSVFILSYTKKFKISIIISTMSKAIQNISFTKSACQILWALKSEVGGGEQINILVFPCFYFWNRPNPALCFSK